MSNQAGSSDIYIGSLGCVGTNCSESNTIRIGADGTKNGQQNATYIAGIWAATAGQPTFKVVCVDLSGKLWGAPFGTDCTLSSRRFKDHIADMGERSNKLLQLRPVTFYYRPEFAAGSREIQYGLIAEEVAKVYPEMVAYDGDGQPYTVKYQMLAPMLLNEFNKQHSTVTAQQGLIESQDKAIRDLQRQTEDLQRRLSQLEAVITNR